MELLADPGCIVLDTRSYHAYAGQHLINAWHLDLNGNFPTFTGWVIPTDKEILIVADDYKKALEATLWARRVGMDRIVGYLDGGMVAWSITGLPTGHIGLISAQELHDQLQKGDKIVLLDVRAPLEFEESHIEGAVNIPVADLRTRYNELDPDKTTVLICSSGNRSSLGASILKQQGFKDVTNVAGGMTGYSAAGYTRACHACLNPHGSRFFSDYREVKKHFNKS
jgi:rhodanese-related sulfurtransferase